MLKQLVAENATVLVVEDDLDLRSLLVDQLSSYFRDVVVAQNGEEALQEYSSKHVDCVVTDYRMPKMSGTALIAELHRRDPDLPIVMLTGYGGDSEVLARLAQDEFELVDKPYEADVLVNRIRVSLALATMYKYLKSAFLLSAPEALRMQFYALPRRDQRKLVLASSAVSHSKAQQEKYRRAS